MAQTVPGAAEGSGSGSVSVKDGRRTDMFSTKNKDGDGWRLQDREAAGAAAGGQVTTALMFSAGSF